KRSWRKPSPHEESEEEHCWDGRSAPKPPRFSAFAPGFLDREASCARHLGIPAPESALGLRLRRALPSAQVRSVYQGYRVRKSVAVYTKNLTRAALHMLGRTENVYATVTANSYIH